MLVKSLFEHLEVPLRAIGAIIIVFFAWISGTAILVISIFDELARLLVDREVGQMDELFHELGWIIGVLLGSETNKSIRIHVHFERVEARD